MNNGTEVEVLNLGSITLLDVFGSDLDVVNAAKVSFAANEPVMNGHTLGLLKFLMKNKHATPFEHVVFKFHVKCPIFVAREWFRHRWSSFNEMSMRYHVPDEVDFFYPTYSDDAIRRQVGKPGNYTFEPINDPEYSDWVCQVMEEVYSAAEDAYYSLVESGLAKELARSILPVGQYTEFIWTVNLRSLINFILLRNSPHAQREILEYAKIIEDIAAIYCKHTVQTLREMEYNLEGL